jgi:hypothetical protein
MISLDIHPFEGAAPIRFGMHRSQVAEILGIPSFVGEENDRWGPGLEINIEYDKNGMVYHLGLCPGDYELRFEGQILWSPNDHPDPNPMFLTRDPEPYECVGFLVFAKLGVTTAGYHDDDPSQRSVVVYTPGAWDEMLVKAKRSALDKYRGQPPSSGNRM